MGSCFSAPLNDNGVTSRAPEGLKGDSAEIKAPATVSSSLTTGRSNVARGLVQQLSNPNKHADVGGSETEEIESTPGDRLHSPLRDVYETKLKDDSDSHASPKNRRKSPNELKAGYSSGGSSGTLDDDECPPSRSPSCAHLVELKHSILADGDICKGVVRIEVSPQNYKCYLNKTRTLGDSQHFQFVLF